MATKVEKAAKQQLKEREKEKKAAQKTEQQLLKQQDKAEKERDKAELKTEKQLAKIEAKAEKSTRKEREDLQTRRVKVLMSRAKAERKPAKVASKALARERNRPLALKKLQKVRKNFLDLPPALWPFMIAVSYIWAKNTWEKERQQRALKEARRFLKETKDLR
jgi:hypothetical protein